MENIHLIKDGFEITFTKPLDSFPKITGQKYDYNWWWEYGSPQQHTAPLTVRNIAPSADGKKLTVKFNELEAGKCVILTINDATSQDGESLLHNQVSYTINKMPGGELAYVAKEVVPPVERGNRVEGWLYLSWLDAFALWENDGVYTCNAELNRDDPSKFVTSEGNGALVAHEGNSMTTSFPVTDGAFRIKFMLASDAKATIDLPIGVQVLLSDSTTGLTGSIVDLETDTLHKATENGYLGAGIWHTLNVKYTANPDHIESVELNGVFVLQDVPIDGTSTAKPIQVKTVRGDMAFGDVRVKQMGDDIDAEGWTPMNLSTDWVTTKEAKVWIEDSGTIVIDGGIGTAQAAVELGDATAIRFDAKIQGIGHSVITFGDFFKFTLID